MENNFRKSRNIWTLKRDSRAERQIPDYENPVFIDFLLVGLFNFIRRLQIPIYQIDSFSLARHLVKQITFRFCRELLFHMWYAISKDMNFF